MYRRVSLAGLPEQFCEAIEPADRLHALRTVLHGLGAGVSRPQVRALLGVWDVQLSPDPP